MTKGVPLTIRKVGNGWIVEPMALDAERFAIRNLDEWQGFNRFIDLTRFLQVHYSAEAKKRKKNYT